MNNYLKEYFTFSKKERTGIIILVALILLTAITPHFFPEPSQSAALSAKELSKLAAEWRLLVTDTAKEKPVANQEVHERRLFSFDPNTLQEEGWKKLGLPDRTIKTIRNYISHGGKFRKPEDLSSIYGLKKEVYERLLPYVRISISTPAMVQLAPRPMNIRPPDKELIDINECDTNVLIALPGIGSRLAQRIIHFREKLGGFYSIDQIGEVYALPDSTFQQIKKRLICKETALKTININAADIYTLREHPYIKWNLATVIVRFREQHGPFRSLDDLMQIALITPEIFKKIVFYLSIE